MAASVLRIKRDPALRVALAVLARRRPGRLDDDRDTGRASDKAWATRGDLQHLFGDRKLMEQVAQASREPHQLVLGAVAGRTDLLPE